MELKQKIELLISEIERDMNIMRDSKAILQAQIETLTIQRDRLEQLIA